MLVTNFMNNNHMVANSLSNISKICLKLRQSRPTNMLLISNGEVGNFILTLSLLPFLPLPFLHPPPPLLLVVLLHSPLLLPA